MTAKKKKQINCPTQQPTDIGQRRTQTKEQQPTGKTTKHETPSEPTLPGWTGRTAPQERDGYGWPERQKSLRAGPKEPRDGGAHRTPTDTQSARLRLRNGANHTLRGVIAGPLSSHLPRQKEIPATERCPPLPNQKTSSPTPDPRETS